MISRNIEVVVDKEKAKNAWNFDLGPFQVRKNIQSLIIGSPAFKPISIKMIFCPISPHGRSCTNIWASRLDSRSRLFYGIQTIHPPYLTTKV